MNRNILLIISIGLLSAVAGVTMFSFTMKQPEFISASVNSNSAPHKSVGTVKPVALSFDKIVLNDLQTKPRYLNEWKSPLLIVNFWAPWCPPCRREIPALVDIQQTYQQNVQLIGLSFDSQQRVTEFNDKYPMNYPLLIVQRESSEINKYFGNNSRALPFTAILNEQREIVFQHSGEISKEQLENQIKALL